MLTLLEIARREEIVLFDSSANPANYLPDSLYDSGQYADINRSLLTTARNDLQEFVDFLLMDNTFTTFGTLQNFRNYQKIIASKQRFLNTRQRESGNGNHSAWSAKKEMFDDIASKVFQIFQRIKLQQFTPNDAGLYAAFEEALPHVLDQAGETLIISEENARMYAAALYLSLNEGKSVGLLFNAGVFGRDLETIARAITDLNRNSPLNIHPITRYVSHEDGTLAIAYTTKNEERAQAVNT
jgi:hypothetical protein